MQRRRFLEWAGFGAAAATISLPERSIAQIPQPGADRNSFKAADFGAVGNGTGDESASIQRAIDAANALGGGTVFLEGTRGRDFRCSKPLVFDERHGVRLVGNSGPGGQYVSQLVYTGTQAPFISIRSARSVSFEGLTIAYNNPGFTGTLVSTGHTEKAKADAAYLVFDRCWFTGVGQGRRASALLDLGLTICSTVQNCEFIVADVGIVGVTPERPYSNAIQILNCVFANLNKTAISHGGESWLISGCTFEPLVNGTGSAYVQGTGNGSWGLVIIGCWMGDTSKPGGCWIDMSQGRALGLSIIGNRMAPPGSGPKDTAIKIGANNQGVSIMGNRIEGSIGVDFSAPYTYGASIIGNDLQASIPVANLQNVVCHFVAGHYTMGNSITGSTVFDTATFNGDGVHGGINLLPQTFVPTKPRDGDMWTTKDGLFVRIAGATRRVNLT
jgi:hypothetical protein